MKIVINDERALTPTFHRAGEIPVSQHLREVFAALHSHELKNLFQYLRLDLHSRMSGLDDRGLIQLQGKLDYNNELEKLFQDLLK